MTENAADQSGRLTPLAASDFELLLEASRALSSQLDLRQLLQTVINLAAQVVRAEAGSILLLDEVTQELFFDAAMGAAGEQLRGRRLKSGEGIAGWVAQNRTPLIVNDARKDARWSSRTDEKSAFVTRQVVAVPLLHQGRCLGVVEGINKKGADGFSSADRRALEIFASQVAVAVENARLFEKVREEKETLAALFREMSDGAVLVDDPGRVVYINETAARYLGTDSAAGTGPLLRALAKDFDARPDWEEALTGEGSPRIELSRKQGKTFVLEGSLQRLLGGRGRLFIFRDVTEQKREERVKRNFLSLISHKLRTPLAVITGYAPLLLKDKALTPLPRKGLEAIDAQGRRLADLVDKLLRFTAMEADELNLTRAPLVPRFEIEAVIQEGTARLAEKGAAVAIDPMVDALPSVSADAERFRDVFRNLIDNAVKFNTRPAKDVRVAGGVEGDRVRITVEDNGPGIPAEELPKLFHRFHQIEENFTGQVEGAGLGLALCKRLLEAHGGTLTAESNPAGGVTFVTRWPRA